MYRGKQSTLNVTYLGKKLHELFSYWPSLCENTDFCQFLQSWKNNMECCKVQRINLVNIDNLDGKMQTGSKVYSDENTSNPAVLLFACQVRFPLHESSYDYLMMVFGKKIQHRCNICRVFHLYVFSHGLSILIVKQRIYYRSYICVVFLLYELAYDF